ncbi:MAG: hypothetical protein XD75_0022 [Parcubacteria bacterium 33_209]|nr:MAG: hypothetical protein XD75_0022 [Parcubacteria bacterium 33_209]
MKLKIFPKILLLIIILFLFLFVFLKKEEINQEINISYARVVEIKDEGETIVFLIEEGDQKNKLIDATVTEKTVFNEIEDVSIDGMIKRTTREGSLNRINSGSRVLVYFENYLNNEEWLIKNITYKFKEVDEERWINFFNAEIIDLDKNIITVYAKIGKMDSSCNISLDSQEINILKRVDVALTEETEFVNMQKNNLFIGEKIKIISDKSIIEKEVVNALKIIKY